MASTIVNTLQAKGASYDVILATVLCWLALATALLGVALWITGRLRLATLVQYLPMPVVGGYLAFIGFYCLATKIPYCSWSRVFWEAPPYT